MRFGIYSRYHLSHKARHAKSVFQSKSEDSIPYTKAKSQAHSIQEDESLSLTEHRPHLKKNHYTELDQFTKVRRFPTLC